MAIKKYFYELMTDARHNPFDRVVCLLLWVLSLVYGVIVRLTRLMYQLHWLPVYKSPKPVISVGNITTGGTGKTPLVICLVNMLKQKNIKPVVLSRGYGAIDGQNDEVKMFQELIADVSVMTGRNRKLSIQKAIEVGRVDLFVADDAFSHWPLHRDLNIVAMDATNPFGNGQLVPRGILREEVLELSRADIFVLTKTDEVSASSINDQSKYLQLINPKSLVVLSQHQPQNFQNVFTGAVVSLSELKGQKVIAFSGIGQPSSFERSLEKLGVVIKRYCSFADHHQYQEQDISVLMDFAKKENVNILVTTHKDAVKISPLQNLFKDLIVVRLNISLEITQGKNELIKRISSL